ncbi:hypothetical protein [Candidatus Riesia pediculicola]|uniref:hypothetical protein n=1 Tax=Candidatus Riesia pediculicola TaxID=401619 RepID=UPI0009C3CBF4|nr:hypothetical protein [Candidatus Riesia pediculicola]ARC54265.1 hypothetical protein AOE57_01485 [Candidatus Riesia pediculicola]
MIFKIYYLKRLVLKYIPLKEMTIGSKELIQHKRSYYVQTRLKDKSSDVSKVLLYFHDLKKNI